MSFGSKETFVTGLTETATTDVEGVGALRVERDSDGEKMYKWVKYSAGAVAAVAGNVAYYVTATGYATQTVTSDLSASAEIGAGVLQAVIADGSYGWIQVGGLATLTPALTAGVDGDPLTPTGASDGTLDVVAVATSAVCAYADDASAKTIICAFPL